MTCDELRRAIQADARCADIFHALNSLKWEIQIAMAYIEDGNEQKALKRLEKVINWESPDLPV